MSNAGQVSPLAPPGGFPDLPPVAGVRLSAAKAGVRYRDRLDVMLAEISAGAAMAGVFTRSATRSAPVLWCEQVLHRLQAQGTGAGGYAIVVNSGNANAFTGKAGQGAVDRTVAETARVLSIPEPHVFLASTGVIGEPLPADRITAVLGDLRETLSEDGLAAAAHAIMTTDTFPKGAGMRVELDGAPVTISGIAKGSGMIAPDMATMLVFIFTDAAIAQQLLQDCVSRLTRRTFNAITVDGDTSTSDTLLVAATGKASMERIADLADPRLPAFEAALEDVMRNLAHQVVRDGEGATKFVEIAVSGAVSDEDARKVGMSIANSPLVKTAIAGEDPNWGRIVMAVGKSGAEADRDRLSIRFGDILVAEEGWVSPSYAESAAAAYMKRDEIVIRVNLGLGSGAATIWTCDLTQRYIEINADYRS
jgi:glutamate N-acetyltransferase / amino-acid N-acetyltransferase